MMPCLDDISLTTGFTPATLLPNRKIEDEVLDMME